jgi:hypothetical protein
MAPPWSAGTCHRFGTGRVILGSLYQSGDKSPHSKEAPLCSIFLFRFDLRLDPSLRFCRLKSALVIYHFRNESVAL